MYDPEKYLVLETITRKEHEEIIKQDFEGAVAEAVYLYENKLHDFYFPKELRSDQKGSCEVTHEMIRRILPKKSSFDNLTRDDITLMMSHINSYNRKKLNNQSPHQLFSFINGGDILEMLGIKAIPVNEINLTPLLLKK